MDREEFKKIVDSLNSVFQLFTIGYIVEALVEGGQKLSVVKIENAAALQRQNAIMSDWDSSDAAGKAEIEANLTVYNQRIPS